MNAPEAIGAARARHAAEAAAAAAAATAAAAVASTAAAGAPGPTLVAEGVHVRLGDATVVEAVDLVLRPGTWTALVGPNGAGKSSLVAALAGVRRPSRGRVFVAAGEGAQQRELVPGHRLWPRTVSWLAQTGEAEGDIGVRDVVRLGRLPHHGVFGAPDAADEAAVDAAMRETGVEDLADRRLRTLSGGERQRVLLARVLAVRAPVMLLDEPATHLDAPHQQALVRAVRRHVAAGGTALTVLHDLTQALMADELVVLARGRRVAQGARDDERLHREVEAAFDHAFSIGHVGAQGRWVAVPQA
jgi:iron complex transport system ATP-binding protein